MLTNNAMIADNPQRAIKKNNIPTAIPPTPCPLTKILLTVGSAEVLEVGATTSASFLCALAPIAFFTKASDSTKVFWVLYFELRIKLSMS